MLGVFEGANREDFLDALPLYIITEQGTIGQIDHADVTCSRGFRYVRYIGPSDARCNIAEIEFYGHPGDGNDSCLYQVTNLPTVTIHTVDGTIPYDKEHEIESQVTIISQNGAHILSEPAGVRERGNASRSFPKKPYRIKFDKKQHVLDAPAKAKKWTLINNYGDKTLMRNLLAFELSRLLGLPYTPYGRAVDVLLNGEYKGCYQLCDQIQVHKNRVNITEMTPDDVKGEALTGGYFIEVDAYASQEDSWFNSVQGNPVTIKSPDSDSIATEQYDYIRVYFNRMEASWQKYLDLNTFLRHFLVGEASGNTDTYWSVFMYKERSNDTLYTGPVWDFDLAFENDDRTYPVNDKRDYIYRTVGSCAGNMRKFVDKIAVQNTAARTQLENIWAEARIHGDLSEEHMLAVIDSLASELQESQRLNFLRWPIMNQYVHQNPRLWGSYEAEVENVRRFTHDRFVWMDNKLNFVYTGIQPTFASQESDIIYNLMGQPVGNDVHTLSPGIYIYRGKKIHIR